MKKYHPEDAKKIIEPAVNKKMTGNKGMLCVHRNVLGLKKLGALDYLVNKCNAQIIWIGERRS